MSRGENDGAMRRALGDCVGTFKSGQNAFGPRQLHYRVERRGVILRDVLGAAGVMQSRMLRTDRCVIQTSRNRMRRGDLSVFVLQHIREGALQDARCSAVETRRMLAEFGSAPAGLHADEPHLSIGNELVESPDRIGPATDACDAQRLAAGLPSPGSALSFRG